MINLVKTLTHTCTAVQRFNHARHDRHEAASRFYRGCFSWLPPRSHNHRQCSAKAMPEGAVRKQAGDVSGLLSPAEAELYSLGICKMKQWSHARCCFCITLVAVASVSLHHSPGRHRMWKVSPAGQELALVTRLSCVVVGSQGRLMHQAAARSLPHGPCEIWHSFKNHHHFFRLTSALKLLSADYG